MKYILIATFAILQIVSPPPPRPTSVVSSADEPPLRPTPIVVSPLTPRYPYQIHIPIYTK